MRVRSWTYGVCETCLKNVHEEVKMVRQVMLSTDPEGKYSEEMWVCGKCGASKKL